MENDVSDWRFLHLKRANNCIVCGMRIEIGQNAFWSPSRHSIKCLSHDETYISPISDVSGAQSFDPPNGAQSPLNAGTPGGSAKAQADRRVKQRQDRVNERFPRAGKYLLRIFPEPQSTKAWQAGAKGEIGAGLELEKLAPLYGFKVIHDRLIPGSKANIDHIAITRSGIFVIDAKNYSGKIRIVDQAGFLETPNPILYVGGRNCTHLVTKMHYQVDIVQRVLRNRSIEMPVTGVLAFYRGDWELLSSIFPQEVIQGVLVNNKGIEKILNRDGDFSLEEIDHVTKTLASKLKPAS